MNQEQILKKIQAQAKALARKRKNPRFLDVIGFLVVKGFLGTNYAVPLRPNKKLFIEDAIWAGKNVEPRILEVLPAAVLRLPAHFDFDPIKHPKLATVIELLAAGKNEGPDFFDVPYRKIKAWVALPLKDKRVKPIGEHKLARSFRLHPKAAAKLKQLAGTEGCSEAEWLERKILGTQ